jgi:hypothetical protein
MLSIEAWRAAAEVSAESRLGAHRTASTDPPKIWKQSLIDLKSNTRRYD